MKLPITKETFRLMEMDGRTEALFDIATATYQSLQELRADFCNKKKADYRISALFGFVGGFTAMLVNFIFKR